MAFQSRYLKKGEFVYILRELYLGNETGTLSLSSEQSTKFFYLKEGYVIFAASNNPEDKFTSILIRMGKITTEQFDMAMKKKGDNTIGKALVELGFITSEELVEALGFQVANIAKTVVNWSKGMASFKKNVLPPKVVQLNVDMPRFIVDTTLAVDDRDWVVAEMGGMNSVFYIAQPVDAIQKIAVFPEEKKLLQSIDGKKSVKAICDELGGDAFRWAKYIYSLYLLGHLKKKGMLQYVDVVNQQDESSSSSSTVDLSFLDEGNKTPGASKPIQKKVNFEEEKAVEDNVEEEEIGEEGQKTEKEKEVPILFAHQPAVLTDTELQSELPEIKPEPPVERITMKKKPPKKAPVLLILFIIILIAGGVSALFLWRQKVPKVLETPKILTKKPNVSEVVPPAGAEKYFRGKEANTIKPTLEPAQKPSQPVVAPKKEPEKTEEVIQISKTSVKPLQKEKVTVQSSGTSLLSSGKYGEAADIFNKQYTQEKGKYTIQIEIACQEDTVSKAVTGSSKSANLWISKINYKGKPCYRVLWGQYKSKEDGEGAVKTLPDFFKDTKPAIISISSIH